MNKIVKVFDWIKHINQLKTPIEEFTNDDFDKFNSYVIHLSLSMNPDYIDLVNYVQHYPPQEKRAIYQIYKEFIPKNNKWSKYLKSKTKQTNPDLINHLKDHFQVSSREVKEYIPMLGTPNISRILTDRGVEIKEIKQLLK